MPLPTPKNGTLLYHGAWPTQQRAPSFLRQARDTLFAFRNGLIVRSEKRLRNALMMQLPRLLMLRIYLISLNGGSRGKARYPGQGR